LVEDSLGLHKIFEKFSRNYFFLKFHVRISTKFGTKHERFQVKWMSIHLGKKIKQFHTQMNLLSTLAVMTKKFIANLVERICGSNLRKTQYTQ